MGAGQDWEMSETDSTSKSFGILNMRAYLSRWTDTVLVSRPRSVIRLGLSTRTTKGSPALSLSTSLQLRDSYQLYKGVHLLPFLERLSSDGATGFSAGSNVVCE